MKGRSLTGSSITNCFSDFLLKYEGNYLEIGIFDGYNLCLVAKSIPLKICYGIDPFISDGHIGYEKGTPIPEHEKNCKENMQEVPNTKLFRVTSEEFLKNLTDEMINEMNVSAVYIDGSHHFPDVIIDIELAIKLIGSKPGLIIFDDLHISDVKEGIKWGMEKYPEHLRSISSTHYINI
ncbi:MAG TPA: class I SAM-dependent methyltransferase [Bacteroidales bacterium]|nr:class I SAM-dependent methyltransferase [Bacteroidales bacterium]